MSTPIQPIDHREETLDPQDWEQMRALLHQMIDDSIDYMQDLRGQAPWTPMGDNERAAFAKATPPRSGIGSQATYQDYLEQVQPYIMGNNHPKFWAWYMGNGSMMGAMADYLTAITNSNAGAGNHVGQHIEDQVISWMTDIIGYPDTASGMIVSGGSMANYVGLATARHHRCGYDIRQKGILAGGRQLCVYGSTEVHNCNQKAIELLGIGREHFRKIPVNEDYTMDLNALKAQIQADKAAGLHPICVIASAGTVNTGAIDDLHAIADICEDEGLWYHVDGAIGAIAMTSDIARPQLTGIERSDSVALDLHKWLHIPFEAGCVLVRNRQVHRDTFVVSAEYLQENKRGLASGKHWYSEYGLQLSRRLNALKIWMSIKEQGIDKYGRLISQNIRQAHYLGELIHQHQSLQLMAPVGLDIVCYRYNPGGLTLDQLNDINQYILAELHVRGIAIPSYTTLRGSYCLRVAIANHRSLMSDFTELAHATVSLGEEYMGNTPQQQQ